MLAVEADLDNLEYPIHCGLKLDGIRCLVVDGVLQSRSGKPIRNHHLQSKYGRPEFEGFDGELVIGDVFAHDVFQVTSSGVMSANKVTEAVFYVFDMWNMPDVGYEERHSELCKLAEGASGIVVLHTVLCHSKIAVEEQIEAVRVLGGEGVILRKVGAGYKYGRSTFKQGWLLKFKFFEQDEFEIIGFDERMHNENEAFVNELGRTSRSSHQENMTPMGTLGSIILAYQDDLVFKCGTGFSDVQRQEIWDNQEQYLGKLASIRYMIVGAKDLPRVPSFYGIRDLDDMS